MRISLKTNKTFLASTLLCLGLNSTILLADNSVIVKGKDLETVKAAVRSVGGTITHELGVIRAVGAKLTDDQLQRLRALTGIQKIYNDAGIKTNGIVPSTCSVKGKPKIKFNKGNAISWEIKNTGKTDVHLESAMILWPTANGNLVKINYSGSTIFRSLSPAPSLTVNSKDWTGDIEDREIEDNDRARIVIKFDRKPNKDPLNYEIRLFFKEGCSVEFPVSSSVLFEGDSDKKAKPSFVASQVGASKLHDEGIDGSGITVAVIDTGVWASRGSAKFIRSDAYGSNRLLAQYDALAGKSLKINSDSDANGHGSHVSSIIVSSRRKSGEFNGIAPNANLISVRAFDRDGEGSYANTIRALDWVVTHKDDYNIRVVNLSFSAPPQSYYWDDPINQAVMAAWQAGIVVVASAGNKGPDPMTIGVPGNVPYVITVGAVTDNMTPKDPSDDTLATFSSAGPTFEGFVKPEILAPGGHIRGLMKAKSRLEQLHPEFYDGNSYYTMSGTSQSAAVVTGIVALLLQADPGLTPDDVKCRLMASAHPATDSNGRLAYSIFQQGAGLVDAYKAVHTTASGCANQGLDIEADLAGTAHFGGAANRDENGNYYIMGLDGYLWSDGYLQDDVI